MRLPALLLMTLALLSPALPAQTLESALMPGPVIQGHAKAEHECSQCHVRGNRAAQPRLCLECHTPVAQDIDAGRGYHGRLKERTCRSCHTEHKGRDARIVKLDKGSFDHAQTDFPLRGKHAGRECASCHKAGSAWRQAPAECVACHRKDDAHKGALGERCASCHQENRWPEARFDHGKTRFPLKLSHADAECKDCHADKRFKDTPRECIACHRDDDAHKGRLGTACARCHVESRWKQPDFRHDRDTDFPLLDRHRSVKCDSCHRASPYREKTPMQCVACHLRDDAHQKQLGDKCDRCHSARGWKDARFDHDKDTHFPLRDSHAKAKCESCHTVDANAPKGARQRTKTPDTCIACHEKDDKEKGHKGRFGKQCDTCHEATQFKRGRFDHAGKTPFPLLGRHDKTRCDACHKTPLYDTRTDSTCSACHAKDDVHFKSYGTDCDRCHVPDDWRTISRNPDGSLKAPSPMAPPP